MDEGIKNKADKEAKEEIYNLLKDKVNNFEDELKNIKKEQLRRKYAKEDDLEDIVSHKFSENDEELQKRLDFFKKRYEHYVDMREKYKVMCRK